MARDPRRGSAWGAIATNGAITNDGASAYSDVDSNEGRNLSGNFMPSSKAQVLATEIASIEQKCDFLEQRNRWLTEKLLRSQRSFIERTMINNQKIQVGSYFQGWKSCMNELRLEHQLEQSTSSLGKCQQVAKELGAALAREQEVSRKEQAARRQVEADYEQLADAQAQLKQTADQQESQIQILQRQLQLVMSSLSRNRSDAQSVIDTVDEIESRLLEVRQGTVVVDLPRTISQSQSSTIEESMKLRDEAQEVMREMTGILQQNSPERRAARQMSKQSASLGASRSSNRTPSPMDGRFQSVTEIVSSFEQAPSVVSGSEIWASVVADGGGSPKQRDRVTLSQGGASRSASTIAGVPDQRSPIFGRQTIAGSTTVSSGDAARKRGS